MPTAPYPLYDAALLAASVVVPMLKKPDAPDIRPIMAAEILLKLVSVGAWRRPAPRFRRPPALANTALTCVVYLLMA